MMKDLLALMFWILKLPMKRFRELASKGAFVIVNYHRVCDQGYGGIDYPSFYDLRTPPLLFAEHLAFFEAYFEVCTLEDALAHRPSKKPKLVITFDDGYADNYQFSWPILKKYNFPALIYVVSRGISPAEPFWDNQVFYSLQIAGPANLNKFFFKHYGVSMDIRSDDQLMRGIFSFLTYQVGSQEERSEIVRHLARETDSQCPKCIYQNYYLNRKQLCEMERFCVQIGSHTRQHCLLARSKPDEVASELALSKQDLEDLLGHEVKHLCYPSGSFDENVMTNAKKIGYQTATTVIAGENHPNTNPFCLRRNGVSKQNVRYLGFELSGWKNNLKRSQEI